MLITNRRRFRDEVLGVWRRRDLLLLLARRDMTLRYRQTLLGVGWVVLQPLLFSGIFSFVFGSVAHLPSEDLPYFLFAFSGMVGWNLFANGVTRASSAMLSNSALVSKIYFPRLILPLSALGVCLVDALVSCVAALAFVLADGRPLHLVLLTLPIWLCLIALLAAGIGLIAGALVVRFRDVQYLVPVCLQVLLFGSAVVYAASAVPGRFRTFIDLNPVATLVNGARWSLVDVGQPGIGSLAVALGCVLVTLGAGLEVFRRAESGFADVI